MTTVIDRFAGEHRFLSNFFYVDIWANNGMVFPTAEHAYQAAKSENSEVWAHISRLQTPGEAKRAGRNITLRPDWNQVKYSAMDMILREKFQYEALAQKLIDTGDAELIEGNTWGDVYWGVCRGKGQNQLGKLLMQIRKELQS